MGELDEDATYEPEQSPTALLTVLFIFVALMVFFILIGFAAYTETAAPVGMESEVLITRFVSSPYCFAYQDSLTGRVYDRVIDANLFTQERLDSCFDVGNANMPAFSMTLESESGIEKGPITTSNWAHGGELKQRNYDIIVNEAGNLRGGKLHVSIANYR